MKNNIIPAIALIAFATPGLAAAEVSTAKSSLGIAVRYSDLDLQDPRAAKVMLRRIRRTAVEICHPGETGFEATARFETCYRNTVDEAVARLNAPVVTEALNSADSQRKLARLR